MLLYPPLSTSTPLHAPPRPSVRLRSTGVREEKHPSGEEHVWESQFSEHQLGG